MLVTASQSKLNEEIRRNFLRSQIGIGFLFDDDVVKFVQEAREQMHAIDVFDPANNKDASPEDRKANLERYHKAWNRAAEMTKEVDAVFATYLDFKKLK